MRILEGKQSVRESNKHYINAIGYRLICRGTGPNNISLNQSRMLFPSHVKTQYIGTIAWFCGVR